MARDLAVTVLTALVLALLAVLTARMRQQHRIVLRLFEPSAVACVLRHLVLSVRELAVRARPVVEGEELALALFGRGSTLLLLVRVVVAMVLDDATLLFLFVLSNVLLQALVQLADPALDAAQVKRLATLTTIPEG